jgi:hypothetical protein
MVQTYFKQNKPAPFSFENNKDFEEHYVTLTCYLERAVTLEAWATRKKSEGMIQSDHHNITHFCEMLLLNFMPHKALLIMSCTRRTGESTKTSQ